MCGRFTVYSEKDEMELSEIIGRAKMLGGDFNIGEIYPTQLAPVLTAGPASPANKVNSIPLPDSPDYSNSNPLSDSPYYPNSNPLPDPPANPPDVALMKWGYSLGNNRPPVINSRSETVAQKPMFAADFALRRCVVPSAGFFEWERHMNSRGRVIRCDKYLFRLHGNEVLYMAGIYRFWGNEVQFSILTAAAGEGIAGIHDRMPVILTRGQIMPYIRSTEYAAEVITADMPQVYAAACG